MRKTFLKSVMLMCAVMFASTSMAQVQTVGSPSVVSSSAYSTDPFGPNVAKIMRPAGTQDAFIKFTDGSSTTLSNGWNVVSGNSKVFQSWDGVNGSFDGTVNTSATAQLGLDAGYDAVAFVKANSLYQYRAAGTRCVSYYFLGGSVGKLCTPYFKFDWLFVR